MRGPILFAIIIVGSNLYAQGTTTPGYAAGSRSVDSAGSQVQPTIKQNQVKQLASSQLAFIENRGQFHGAVKFQVKRGDKVLWFTSKGVVFDVVRQAAESPLATGSDSATTLGPTPSLIIQSPGHGQPAVPSGKSERLVFFEEFKNGRESPKIEASAVQPGIYSYFIGNDPQNWRAGVKSYSALFYRDVWPGIDIRFVVKDSDIEQEFLVRPGADTSQIRVGYNGVKGVHVGSGSLVVQTTFGPLQESAPRIYQDIDGRRTSVPGHYRTSGEFAYTFQVGTYSKTNPLVIDPTLLFSTLYRIGETRPKANG